MSLLRNSSFESAATAPWERINIPNAVAFEVRSNRSIAKSGNNYLRFSTTAPGGSMGQDIQVTAPSVSALAWVRAEGANPVAGILAIWQLDTNVNVSTDFVARSDDWTLVTCMKDIQGAPNRPVRIEFYLNSTNLYVLVDSVAVF